MSEALADMEKSLSKKPSEPVKPSSMPIVAFDFSEISSQLKMLVAEKQRVGNMLQTFTQVDLDIKMLVDKTDANLMQMVKLQSYVENRLKAQDTLEAKWNLLMERVNSVLDDLERVLARI